MPRTWAMGVAQDNVMTALIFTAPDEDTERLTRLGGDLEWLYGHFPMPICVVLDCMNDEADTNEPQRETDQPSAV